MRVEQEFGVRVQQFNISISKGMEDELHRRCRQLAACKAPVKTTKRTNFKIVSRLSRAKGGKMELAKPSSWWHKKGKISLQSIRHVIFRC